MSLPPTLRAGQLVLPAEGTDLGLGAQTPQTPRWTSPECWGLQLPPKTAPQGSHPHEHHRALAPAAGEGGERAQHPLKDRRDQGNCSLATSLQNPEKALTKMQTVQCPGLRSP